MATWFRNFAPLALLLSLVTEVAAAPEAHLLRIDPRTAVLDGNPVLTTVIDLTESHRIGEVTSECATLRGKEQMTCMSDALEKPRSLASPHPFPEDDVILSVKVDDSEFKASLLSHSTFEKSQRDPGVGTAWLIIVDADDRMDKALDEANAVASRFVDTLGPNDLVNLIYLSDRQVLADTKWLDRSQLDTARKLIEEQDETIRSQGRTRPLLDLIQGAASDSFRSLGSSSEGKKAPLHQAMVVISTGYGGGDPSTTGPGASKLSEYFTKGRFDDENTAIPKLPIPVISIHVPPKGLPEHQQLARTFMQNLANPSIGGFFTILQDGQADHAGRIVDAVRSRFAHLIIARFRLSCLAPSTTQSFSLLFKNSGILGDGTFNDVPIGFDPSEWPLHIDAELTRKTAREKGGVYPGGGVRVFGDFCWGTDASRPEAYFLPPGEALPQDLSENASAASQVQKRLASLDMRAPATQANSSFVEFVIPDVDQIVQGEGERSVVRLVVVDTKSRRTSGLTESTVLTVRGGERPVPPWKYAAAAGGGLLLLLLAALFFRRGSKRTNSIPPRDRSPTSESPYATPSPVSRGPRNPEKRFRANVEGAAGRFTILEGSDLRCGRDGSRCAAVINNPQVSGLHATFRIENGRLLVRDEGSTSGTRVDGQLLEPGKWVSADDGVEVALGPELLRVTLIAGS